MLPIVLVLLFALELFLCFSIGLHLFGDGAMHRLGELAVCIFIWLLFARLCVVALSFVYSIRRNQARREQGLGGWIRTVWNEYRSTVFAFSLLIPLRWLFAPRAHFARPSPPTAPVTVLLVHGFMSNSGVWWLFARRLRSAGLPFVDSVELGGAFESIDRHVLRLDQRIRELQSAGANRIVLIGHSMGGLVCRAWLAQHSSTGIDALITLGTPHGGSEFARWFASPNLRQMRPDSAWLRQLPAQPNVPARALFSVHDNIVVPRTLGLTAKIEIEEWRGLGHLSMLFDRSLHARVVELIAKFNRETSRV